jgi:hypothetical protein
MRMISLALRMIYRLGGDVERFLWVAGAGCAALLWRGLGWEWAGVGGGAEPAGLFVRAQDKNYVLVRLDAQGDHPYSTVYHAYTHYIRTANYEPKGIFILARTWKG